MRENEGRRRKLNVISYSLRMARNIWWSKYVICSAISSADNVSMLSLLGDCVFYAAFKKNTENIFCHQWNSIERDSFTTFCTRAAFLLTVGGASSNSKFFLAQSISSRVRSRSNCEAARCSPGNKLGLHVISSRNSIVCDRSFSSCSKSWKCFETQCLWGKERQ